MMQDLIPPHGGVSEPVDRTVPADEVAEFRKSLQGLPRLPVSDADLSSLYRFGDGGLSPLTGPMDRATYDRVLDEEILVNNGKRYAWTIPIALPVDRELARTIKPGAAVALANSRDEVVGTLEVREVFPWDKPRYLRSVYGTDRTDHPGGRMTLGDPRDMLVGGDVRVLPQPRHPEFGQFVLSPRETRALFRQKGWQRVVAFQTRNPLHRAHEHALVAGLQRLARESRPTGAVLT